MNKKTGGMIAGGHPKTVEAGKITFENGGNAFDATIAAVLASFVVEPALTSAAGGGFLLAHTCNQQNILFDFFTQTPRHKKPLNGLDFYPVQVNFGDALQEFHIGLASMAVPGSIAGVFHIHQKLGRLPLKIVAEPAIEYAKKGVEINDFQNYLLHLLEPILLATAEGREIYAPQGKLYQVGEVIRIPDFANTLEYLIENGIQEFYEGEIAHLLVRDCQEQGGYLTLEDLKNYQVIERKPLQYSYRGHTLLTNPPPSSGGTLIAFALKLLSKLDLSEVEFGTEAHLQILAEVMRLTNTARKDGYNERLYEENIAEAFLSDEHLAEYAQELLADVNKLGSTTHISVMDEEGNAASVTASNGEGSGYVIPGTGIMVNNMLGEEDLNPLGFHEWSENLRISSMMAPTLILKDKQPEIVLGSGGSNRIRTAILQVVSNILDFKMAVEEAVNSPRIHWENYVLNLEPGLNFSEAENEISPDSDLVIWQRKSMFFGGVHTLVRDVSGSLGGAGDRRRSGAVARIVT